MTLDASGQLGIGTTSPATKLDVTGTIQARAAATQDGVQLTGRAGGTSSYAVAITPTTLTASRTLTLPDVSGTVLTTGAAVTVAQGGTGLTSGTSGGVLYYSASGTLASSAALAASAIVLGGGAGVAPATTTTGTGVVTAIGNTANSSNGLAVLNASGVLDVTKGGTGASSGNAGGVLYYSAASTISSSSVLTANAIMLGGGATGPVTTTTGTGVVTALSFAVNATSGLTTTSGTATLTNKRIDPRVTSAATATTLTPDISAADVYAYTALATALTINTPTGTPLDGDRLTFRLLDNGTARALSWSANYTAIGVTLPTTTVANKTTYVGCIYNAFNLRWDVIAVSTQL
jgi:hypothetical protein